MVKYLFLTSEQAQEAINYAVNSYVLPDQTLIVNGVTCYDPRKVAKQNINI